MSIAAMKQMLEALEFAQKGTQGWTFFLPDAITAGRQAIEQAEKNQFNPDWDAMAVMVEEQQRMAKRIEELEQAEKQEPVAVARVDDLERGGRVRALAMGLALDAPLYTTPPQREWVEITDEQIAEAIGDSIDDVYFADFRKVIAKVKEMNT